MKRVYIAGPYTKGDTILNIRAAIDAGSLVRSWGHAPMVPHLTAIEHLVHAREYEHWMETDFMWVIVSDCLYRVPGESAGADREVAVARQNGIPVFDNLKDLAAFLGVQE